MAIVPQFSRAGALGVGGFTLADLLRAEGDQSGRPRVINIHLDGGPPQMDMIDPKPEAPGVAGILRYPIQAARRASHRADAPHGGGGGSLCFLARSLARLVVMTGFNARAV